MEKWVARFGLALAAMLVLVPTNFVHTTPQNGLIISEGDKRISVFLLLVDGALVIAAIGVACAVIGTICYCLHWCWIHK